MQWDQHAGDSVTRTVSQYEDTAARIAATVTKNHAERSISAEAAQAFLVQTDMTQEFQAEGRAEGERHTRRQTLGSSLSWAAKQQKPACADGAKRSCMPYPGCHLHVRIVKAGSTCHYAPSQ